MSREVKFVVRSDARAWPGSKEDSFSVLMDSHVAVHQMISYLFHLLKDAGSNGHVDSWKPGKSARTSGADLKPLITLTTQHLRGLVVTCVNLVVMEENVVI